MKVVIFESIQTPGKWFYDLLGMLRVGPFDSVEAAEEDARQELIPEFKYLPPPSERR